MARAKRLDLPKESNREVAKRLLRECKKKEQQQCLVAVRIDSNTIKLMPREKAEKLKQL